MSYVVHSKSPLREENVSCHSGFRQSSTVSSPSQREFEDRRSDPGDVRRFERGNPQGLRQTRGTDGGV